MRKCNKFIFIKYLMILYILILLNQIDYLRRYLVFMKNRRIYIKKKKSNYLCHFEIFT